MTATVAVVEGEPLGLLGDVLLETSPRTERSIGASTPLRIIFAGDGMWLASASPGAGLNRAPSISPWVTVSRALFLGVPWLGMYFCS